MNLKMVSAHLNIFLCFFINKASSGPEPRLFLRNGQATVSLVDYASVFPPRLLWSVVLSTELLSLHKVTIDHFVQRTVLPPSTS